MYVIVYLVGTQMFVVTETGVSSNEERQQDHWGKVPFINKWFPMSKGLSDHMSLYPFSQDNLPWATPFRDTEEVSLRRWGREGCLEKWPLLSGNDRRRWSYLLSRTSLFPWFTCKRITDYSVRYMGRDLSINYKWIIRLFVMK